MNQDLGLMIEIQHLWDKVAEANAQAEKCGKSIRHWEETISSRQTDVDRISVHIRNLKNLIKTGELELAANDDRIQKLNERRNQLTSNRELEALDAELKKVTDDRSVLEDSLLAQMDDLDENEKALAGASEDLEKRRITAAADIEDLAKRKADWEGNAARISADAREREESLSPPIRSRFRKLLTARGGKAIVELNGEVCGYCNTGIPPSLAGEVRKNNGINACTNCGRILYHGRD